MIETRREDERSKTIPSPVSPDEIGEFLKARVVGQQAAVRETSIALSKKLGGLRSGHLLFIGASGSGKTTLMRAVESFLAESARVQVAPTVLRIHANVLGTEAASGYPGEHLMHLLLARSRAHAGDDASLERVLRAATSGLIFVDEIDKIRANVGDEPNVRGIRAQEALLTLMENETIVFELPEWAGARTCRVSAENLLFIAAGAFEGLYDAVYDRVTVGADRGSLQPVTVVEDGKVKEELPFRLEDWLRAEDLFDYGMSPQFLARFDARVILDPLTVDSLIEIFLRSADSGYQQAQEYFRHHGVDFALSPDAVRAIATHAARHPRLGARALREVLRRVVARYEYAPRSAVNGPSESLLLDADDIELQLRDRA